jgi:UTP--glucose-1-phosphate uridylyltransferase
VQGQPFAVILADDLLSAKVPMMRQMVSLFHKYGKSILGVEKIAPAQSRSYGIVGGVQLGERLLKMNAIIEKPEPDAAPSDLAVVGRYILTPAIFKHLRAIGAGAGGEVQLTDAIGNLMVEEDFLAYQFEGKRYDCGSKLGYLQATVEFALKHPEVRDEFTNFLRSVAKEQWIALPEAA